MAWGRDRAWAQQAQAGRLVELGFAQAWAQGQPVDRAATLESDREREDLPLELP